MEFRDFFYPSSTGKNQIHGRKLIPDGEIRGIVQIVHGIADHITRYDSFMEFLAGAGFAVCGNDHLGHGKSVRFPSERGYFADADGWTYVEKDIVALHDLICPDYPGMPYILFGHSMGSFLTRTCLIDYPELCDMVILSGTGHKPAALLKAAGILADTVCAKDGAHSEGAMLSSLAFNGYNAKINDPKTPFDWISRDEKIVEEYVADPDSGFTCRNGLYRDMMHGMAYITAPSHISRMKKTTPVYFVSGDADPVGDYGKGVEAAYKAFCNAGCTDVMMRLYPGGRHEMLNETNREQVYRDILEWLNGHLPQRNRQDQASPSQEAAAQ